MSEFDPNSSVARCSTMKDEGNGQGKEKPEGEEEEKPVEKEARVEQEELTIQAVKEEDVPVELEPKTGISFPVVVAGKQLNSVGLRKKSVFGISIKIYGFGIYADNEKLKDLLREKIGKAPSKATKEIYEMVIDSDIGMMVRLVIVFSNLTMNMVRTNFDEGLGAIIKKLTGRKNEELAKMIMGEASNNIKLPPGSIIEISRLPGYTLQTKVRGEIVSTVQSELICRAYLHMYLGGDPFDKEAKEKFGASLLSLF
ncbi:hypothetical protein C2S52_002645 [Perilla frutescens var. hirtella]|nr:hypothetical protein C2S51_012800 [Perilla frutescens var. frutescens]KAH6792168.1 hypothetical protein C2S52_002645 [Perilla frutescens var. hirtella]